MRNTILKEITTNKNLQVLIDRTMEKYRPIIWPNFLSWEDVLSINYETVIGESGIGAAASVVAWDVKAPLRTRKALRKLTGEIPSIREKFIMGEKELQEYETLKARAYKGNETAILNLLLNDVKEASEAPHKRLDLMVLEMMSTGQITLTKENNPDGMILANAIDFGMPDSNKKAASVIWSSANIETAKPLSDIRLIAEAAKNKGETLRYMLMKRSTFNILRHIDEVVNEISGIRIKGIDLGTSGTATSLKKVNEYLISERLPEIKLIEASIGIEKNGVVTVTNPWSEGKVLFIPDGKLGKMLNAPVIEKTNPAKQVSYANYNKVLVKKWSDVDPVSEYTACELNAFPTWNNIESCYLLNTKKTTWE